MLTLVQLGIVITNGSRRPRGMVLTLSFGPITPKFLGEYRRHIAPLCYDDVGCRSLTFSAIPYFYMYQFEGCTRLVCMGLKG